MSAEQAVQLTAELFERLDESPELTRALSKRGESRILFADRAEKLNRKKVLQTRIFVITETALCACWQPAPLICSLCQPGEGFSF